MIGDINRKSDQFGDIYGVKKKVESGKGKRKGKIIVMG